MRAAITMDKVHSFIPIAKAWWSKWWIAAVVFVVVLCGTAHYYTYVYNATDSLPMKFFVVAKQEKQVSRGHFVAFPWPSDLVYPKGIGFIKQVAGVPGDRVVVNENREFTVIRQLAVSELIPGMVQEPLEKSVGRAKTHGERGNMRGVPLELGFTGVIPDGFIYVYAWSKDSLDSRYAILGLVRLDQVIGRAYPIF